jgi:DNA polymerase III epsilon subunit-like protein
MIIVLDTETSGLPVFSYPHPKNYDMWPRIVSVAWKVVSNEKDYPGEHIIVKPDDFVIPENASSVHGISQEIALKEGKEIKDVLKTLAKALSSTDGETVVVCCYNCQFDLGMLESEAHRHKDTEMLNVIKKCKWHCLMAHTTAVLNNGKTYRLADALLQIGGPQAIEDLKNPFHNALGDVEASERLLRLLGERQSD